jgi:hypothetical protein
MAKNLDDSNDRISCGYGQRLLSPIPAPTPFMIRIAHYMPGWFIFRWFFLAWCNDRICTTRPRPLLTLRWRILILTLRIAALFIRLNELRLLDKLKH